MSDMTTPRRPSRPASPAATNPTASASDEAPSPLLVTEEVFADFLTAARMTRVHRYILWQLTSESPCQVLDSNPLTHWCRTAAQPTKEALHRLIHKVERFGDSYAWLITEEHHDALGNFYTPAGFQLEPSWQPGGHGLVRTADNPAHWIPIQTVYPCPYMAPIAVSEAKKPSDWTQPRKPHYHEESDVWVHFTTEQGSFKPRDVLTKMLAPRRTTDAMRSFVGHVTETPSASDMTTAILRYIDRQGLMAPGYAQTVLPDETLTDLLGTAHSFRLSELQGLLRPHYGPFV